MTITSTLVGQDFILQAGFQPASCAITTRRSLTIQSGAAGARLLNPAPEARLSRDQRERFSET